MKILFIFLIALSLRLLFIFFFPQPEVAGDALEYDKLALSILQGKGFTYLDGVPTASREPLYPLFLALIYFLFGHNYLIVRIFQAILGALTCIFIYLIGKRVFSKNCGLLASIFCALYPHLIVTTGFILTETLFTFLLSVSIFFLIKGLEKNRFLILSGIFLGLSTLTRGALLLLPFFFLITFFLMKKNAVKNFLILSIFMGIVVIPWMIRNYIRFHTFTVRIGSGINMWCGTYLPWDGDWNYKDLSDLKKLAKDVPYTEIDKKFYKEAFKNITENPIGYIKLLPKKLYRFWFWIPGGKEVLRPYPKIKIFLAIVQYAVILFALLGIILAWKSYKIFLPILTIIIYFTFFHTFFFLSIPRYHLPLIPYVLIFSARFFVNLLTKRGNLI